MSTHARARSSRPLSGVSDEVLRDAHVGGYHEDGVAQEGVPLDRGATGGVDDDRRRAKVGRDDITGDTRNGLWG